MINALQKIAVSIDKASTMKDDFLVHLLEIFVQLGLQARTISKQTNSKVCSCFQALTLTLTVTKGLE